MTDMRPRARRPQPQEAAPTKPTKSPEGSISHKEAPPETTVAIFYAKNLLRTPYILRKPNEQTLMASLFKTLKALPWCRSILVYKDSRLIRAYRVKDKVATESDLITLRTQQAQRKEVKHD